MISAELIKLNFAPLNLAVEVCGFETDLPTIYNISFFIYMSEMHKSSRNMVVLFSYRDLAEFRKKVFVMMEHFSFTGEEKPQNCIILLYK